QEGQTPFYSNNQLTVPLNDGGLLLVGDLQKIVKVDSDDNKVWETTLFPPTFREDGGSIRWLEEREDGSLFVIARMNFDYIYTAELDSQGTVLHEQQLMEHVEELGCIQPVSEGYLLTATIEKGTQMTRQLV